MRDAALPSVAIGFFDGVHLGHQAILRGASAALTFRNHPQTVLAPGRAPRLVMSVDDRVRAIRACGVSDVAVLDFTPQLAARAAAEFLSFLRGRFGGALRIRCGGDLRFGRGGEGDAEFLRRAGVAVTVVPDVAYAGARISSSRIRAALEGGAVADANAMMGRRFALAGRRERGKGLGAKLGCPTVNVRPDASASGVRIPLGVYEVLMNGERGLANYGRAPTLGADGWTEPVLEVHLLRPSAPNLRPSSPAFVEFVRFLRSERKFSSLEGLRRQIALDFDRIRT